MDTTIRQIRRGTEAERLALGGLAIGEMGLDTDTGNVFIGTGGGDKKITSKGLLLNVKDFNVIGDGFVDDTIAIQAVVDSMVDGDILVFPSGIYKITKPIYVSKSNIKLIGMGATMQLKENERACFHVYGPTMPTRDSDGYTYISTNVLYGQEKENVEVYGFVFDMQPNTGGGLNLGVTFDYMKNCKLHDCEVINTNGNAIEIAHCFDIDVYRNVLKGYRNYGIFLFQSRNINVFDNTVVEGTRNIIVKHAHNGNPNSEIKIFRNHLIDPSDGYGVGGGELFETSPLNIYEVGHEVVGGVHIFENLFEVINATSTIKVNMGTFANEWTVRDNTFKQNNVQGSVIGMGTLGNPSDGGVVGMNHIIENNKFLECDAFGNVVISTGVNVKLLKNLFEGKAQRIFRTTVNAVSTPVTLVEFSDNVIDMGLYMQSSDQVGITTDANVQKFVFNKNKYDVYPLENGANAGMTCLYTLSQEDLINDNEINAKKDVALTHTFSQLMFLNGGGGIVSNNKLTIDSPQTLYGIDVRGDGYKIENNRFELPATSVATSTRGLWVNAIIKNIHNQYIGAWQFNLVDASTDASANQEGTRRVVYGAAAPTAGDWLRGDIVYNLSPVAGGTLGWVCVTAGTPGTWKTFGAITA